jgi:tetratricopeptide (TPR) repeat protein
MALSIPGAALLAQPRGAPPQRGSPPGAETPYILVTAFHAPDKKLAVEGADELRDRLKQEHSAKELFVLTKTSVEGTLQASGYPIDSALSVSDLMELARSMRGEYSTEAWIRKTGQGNAVHVDARLLMRQGQNTLSQPLPGIDAKDPGDAAKQVEKAIAEALKQIPMYKECINSARAQKFDEAVTKARAAIAAYPQAAWSRTCLLNAYTNVKGASPDSIIAVAKEVLATDSTSLTAVANIAEAYRQKNDTTNIVESMLRMYRLDKTNRKIIDGIIPIIAIAAPEKGIQIIDDLLKDNPGDLELTDTKWKLQGRANRYKDAMATGDELVKLDPARATLEWYNRQIGAAQNDSNATKVADYAKRAAEKFPKDASFAMLVSQGLRKAGNLPEAMVYAKRATDADPKDARVWMNSIAIAMDMKQPDSVLALVKTAAAAGADKTQLEQVLLTTVIGPALKKAQETKELADWQALLAAGQAMDAVVSSGTSHFYIGLSKFQMGLDALQNANKLGQVTGKEAKESKAKACTEAKNVEDLWADATIAMTSGGGGAYNKEGATSVMGAIQQYNEYIPQMKKSFCVATKP